VSIIPTIMLWNFSIQKCSRLGISLIKGKKLCEHDFGVVIIIHHVIDVFVAYKIAFAVDLVNEFAIFQQLDSFDRL